MRFRCPACRAQVVRGSKHFPFCSERCGMTDLGRWFNEDYRISRPLTPLKRLEMEESGEWDLLSSEEDE